MLVDIVSSAGANENGVFTTLDAELGNPKLLAMLSVSDVDGARIEVTSVV
jgi:hypothetical protein